jgi:FSR family fosmidomycin resistance protein-like MFS transporter
MSLLAAAPFILVTPIASGAWLLVILAGGSLLLQSTQAVSVTYGQLIVPVGTATVASLTMGVAWGMGGVLVPLIGFAADRIGLGASLGALAVLPLAGAALGWRLPEVAAGAVRGAPPTARGA